MANVSSGAPLTAEGLRGVARIAFYFGTFDPFTRAHRALIETALKDAGIDRVIICPGMTGGSKEPTELNVRLRLIDLDLHSDPKILYPSQGELRDFYENKNATEWARLIRSLAPGAKIDVILGEDAWSSPLNQMKVRALYQPDRYLVFERPGITHAHSKLIPSGRIQIYPLSHPGSSSQVRKWFSEHPESYFAGEGKLMEVPSDIREVVSLKVFEEIRSSGIYLGYPSSNRISLKDRFKNLIIKKLLEPLRLANPLTDIARRKLAKPELRSITIDGQDIPIKKYIANGFTGNVYEIDWEGQRAVLKIPHEGISSREQILLGAITERWLREHTQLKIAKTLALASDGSYLVTAYESGPTVRKFIEEKGLTPDLVKKIESAYEISKNIYQKNGMAIDFNPTNFIVGEKDLILIDTGLQIKSEGFYPSLSDALKAWSSYQKSMDCNLLSFLRVLHL